MSRRMQSTSYTIRTHKIREAYEEALDWVYEKKNKIESSRYGRNRASLVDGLAEQEILAREIQQYDILRAINRVFDKEKKEKLQAAFDELKETSEKKIRCLQTMLDITSLEEHCGRLSREMDLTSVGLVGHVTGDQQGADSGSNIQGFISPSSQDCVFAVQDNWDWVVKLVKCIDIHLKNGSHYHQFFHEVDESAPWLLQDLERIQKSFETLPLTGEYDDAQRLTNELQEVMIALKQWESKTDKLWDKANKVVPVHLRTDGVKEPTAARALCDYSTKEISIREGEDILLLENSKPNTWKIRNCRGDEGFVPALTVLIPGPYKAAIDAAVKLRLQLLAAWTNAIKRLGKRLLCFMLLVFKPDYGDTEIETIRSIPRLDKTDLLRILDYVENTLKSHWSDHEGFINLQERILALRMILEEVGDDGIQDEKTYNSLVVQITSLEKLMNKYKDIWDNWETYKSSLEASQNPQLMLIVDKWEQLKFVTKDFFSNYWKNELPMDTMERSLMTLKTMTLQGERLGDVHDGLVPAEETKDLGGGWEESKVTETKYETERELNRVRKVDLQDALGGAADRVKQDGGFDETRVVEKQIVTETERPVMHSRAKVVNIQDALGEQGSKDQGWEETRVVTMDVQSERPLNRSRIGQVDIKQALGGNGSSEKGFEEKKVKTVYATQVSNGSLFEGEEVFVEGLNEEGIVEVQSGFHGLRASQSEIEGTDFGFATETRTAETEQVQTAEVEEQKTFHIRSVINPLDGNEISLQEAIIAGIIKPDVGMYFDIKTGESVHLPMAMANGLIKVEWTSTRRGQEKRSNMGIITVKTIREAPRPYVIKSVKDMKTNEILTQQEAAKRNVLNEQRGIYMNLKSGERMLIQEAIDKGLIEVEYSGPAPEPEVVSKTYAVRAVVDRKYKRVVTFGEAVRRGIINKETGAYRDSLTNETMYVGDAIMRGYLKARSIDKSASLDIDPENKMLVDKTETIRKKVLQPLKVISAFKRAAQFASMKRNDPNNN